MEEIYAGQRIILTADAKAEKACEELIACENYALDYSDHIPISIGNHPLLAEHFTVIELNGEKVLKICAEEKITNELRLPGEPLLFCFSYGAEYMMGEDGGRVTVDFNGEQVLELCCGAVMLSGKRIADYPKGKFFRLQIAADMKRKRAAVYIDSEFAAEFDFLFDSVYRIGESIENTVLITRGAACKRGTTLFAKNMFPNGALVVANTAKLREKRVLKLLENGSAKLAGAPRSIVNGSFVRGDIGGEFKYEGKNGVKVLADSWDPELDNTLFHMLYFDRPSAKEIIKEIKKNFPNNAHNRLYMTDARRDRILRRIKNGSKKAWYDSFIEEARGYLKEEPPEFCIDDRIRLLPVARLIKRRLLMFSSAYRLSGERQYFEACCRLMERAAEFAHWNDTHFLDTAELCCGFAIAYDAVYDELSQEQRKRFAKTIVEKALVPSLMEYRYGCCRTRNHWADSDGNWNPVCNAGIIIGAIAVLYEYEELAEEIIDAALAGIAYNLTELLPDGAWREGLGYWHYNIEFIAYFFDALYTSAGSVYGYINPDGIGNTMKYYLAMCGPCGAFNYGDMEPMYVKTPEIYWYASVMNKPQLAALYRQMEVEYDFPDTLWSMLNFDTAWEDLEADGVECDMVFGKWWVGSLRSSWRRVDSAYIAFQGGRPNAGHSQMSIGNFVLDINGVRWAHDLGYDDYNLDYLDVSENADAWWIYRKSAEGNNCFLINPDDKLPQVYDSDSKICRFESGSDCSIAELDLSPAYARQAEYAYREFKLDKKEKQVSITDRFLPRRICSEYYWFMHTTAEIEIIEGGAILRESGKTLFVKAESANAIEFLVMDTVQLKSSRRIAVRDREAKNEGVKKLALHICGITGECRVSVVMKELSDVKN